MTEQKNTADSLHLEEQLRAAQQKIQQEDYAGAEIALRRMTETIERECPYQDDEKTVYKTFGSLEELLLYVNLEQPEKTVKSLEEPFARIYFQYGSLLVETQKYTMAQKALRQALHWDPASAMIRFEYAETFKTFGNVDQFLALTREAWPYACRVDLLGRCCRNAAYYLSEKKEWAGAMGYTLMSMEYAGKNQAALAELEYIGKQGGKSVKAPSLEELKKIAANHDLPLGPDRRMLGILLHYADEFRQQKERQPLARQLYQEAYDLTHAEEIRQVLRQMDSTEENA